MKKNKLLLETKDCLPFDNKWNGQLREFAECGKKASVFNLLSSNQEPEPIINFNYQEKKWYAGRYIGSISFTDKKKDITISIKPRFGKTILFKMFEELFNIKFDQGQSPFNTQDNSYYLKILISFIWLQKLANANRHGLPQIKKEIHHTGYTLKGRLLIKPTLKNLFKNGKADSATKEIILDKTINDILHQAHQILKRKYQLAFLTIPDNAREAIQQFNSSFSQYRKVTFHEYRSIKYHPMYQNYKNVVDFSWQIINSSNGFDDQHQNKNISGFFLDMAEIWENYIRSVLKKYFILYGWHCVEREYIVYPDRFYKRKIIPDIVFERDGSFCIFDAKYKKMEYRHGFTDLDRNDFFQIHTYISYFQQKGSVLFGGLIYPVTVKDVDYSRILPIPLFDSSQT
ncbi:MAG: hypothetical protein HOF35_12965, partial [Bacteroidetes bacterium]|nr:hypothetical protein [Bacteroidota bacterium]